MIILVKVDPAFVHTQVTHEQFQIDMDASDSVGNLKILITLKYVDLDPTSFELFTTQNVTIHEQTPVHQLPRNEYDDIVVIMRQRTQACCQLI